MRLGVLFIAILMQVWVNTSQAKVYFSPFIDRPWQTCYTGSTAQAVADIKNNVLPETNSWENLNIKINSRKSILVSYKSYSDHYTTTFKRCSFSEGDEEKVLECAVTVQTPRNETELPWGDIVALDKIWTSDSNYSDLLSCGNNSTFSVKNRWTQKISLRDYKLVREIVELKLPVVANAAGSIINEPGLLPHQKWSAALGFNFLKPMLFKELCDASVEQLSLESALGVELQVGWCPWGIEITELTCNGFKNIVPKVSVTNYKLNFDEEVVRNYCTDNPDN